MPGNLRLNTWLIGFVCGTLAWSYPTFHQIYFTYDNWLLIANTEAKLKIIETKWWRCLSERISEMECFASGNLSAKQRWRCFLNAGILIDFGRWQKCLFPHRNTHKYSPRWISSREPLPLHVDSYENRQHCGKSLD